VPVAVKTTCPPETVMALMAGEASGLTTTVKLLVALKAGVPPSDTCTVTRFVVPAWPTSGRLSGFQNRNGFAPGGFLAGIDFAQIERVPLHHAATAHALVFNQAPVMMLPAIFTTG
jgi:hypothetical protein